MENEENLVVKCVLLCALFNFNAQFLCKSLIVILGGPQIVSRGSPGRRGIFQNTFPFNLCVSFFQTVTELLGQIPNKLFGPNDLKTEVLDISFGLGAS